MKAQAYTLTPPRSEGTSAKLAALCLPGKPGEHLVRNGFTQGGFARLIAAIAHKVITELGKSPNDLAIILSEYSACNASAARQALAKCDIIWLADDGTPDKERNKFDKAGNPQPVSLETTWKGSATTTGAKLTPNEISQLF